VATFEKRSGKTGTSWRVRVRRQSGPWLTRSFKTKAAAEEWARSIEHKLDVGEHVPTAEARKRTLADAIDRYLSVTLPRSKHRKNASEQTRLLTVWRADLGDVALVNLTPARIASARDKLALRKNRTGQPVSGATVNRHLAALSAVLRVSVREYGWLQRNPATNVTRLEDSKGRERFLGESERFALLQECDASPCVPLAAVVRLALATGARKSELMGLQWPNVDLDRRTVRFIDTKNGESRTVPLATVAVEVLRQWRKGRVPAGKVFPYPTTEIYVAWRAARTNENLDNVRIHDMRHSAPS
jgi:integrase